MFAKGGKLMSKSRRSFFTQANRTFRFSILSFPNKEIIAKYTPEYAVMEKVFVNNNPKTTLALGQARGASLTAIALEKIPILELSSNEIKKSIVGNGHATKKQMQFMVKSLLCLNTEVCQDASDALASAITLSHRLKLTHHDQQSPRNNC